MIAGLTQGFPLWALLVSVLAYWRPELLNGLADWIVPLLMLIMFGMGMTLTPEDFRRVLRRPAAIAIGAGLQFLIMPLAAYLVGKALALPEALLIGLVIVGCCPGGTASNVIAYLARADVALSISLTFVTTFLGVLLTPMLIWLYLGESVPVPVASMLRSLIEIVFLPVAVGVALNTLLGKRLASVKEVFPLLSVAAIVLVIGIIVALNHARIADSGALAALAVVLHNGLGLALGYACARLMRLSATTARTIAIEVGMQNSGLGVALALQYFSALSALPGALFSIWHNLSGSLLAWWWRRHTPSAGG
ncbi:MAG: bile acid:sodium symporter family protein [Pseudazoarcus pumilus]|nr:bile acid:sodium symporter family protein [Pseudazoarcus pumilus]